MSLDDLKREWRDEMDRSIPADQLGQLMDGVQRRCAGVERQVHWRDVREIIASVILVAIFASMWPLYRSSPVAILGVALIILGAGLIIYVLLSSRTPEPLPFQASVLECSRHRLAWMDRQIGLLRTVAWWYVGPLISGVLLFNWGLAHGDLYAFVPQAVVAIVIGTGVVLLNQWAVRQAFEPVRDDLVRLIETLESTDRE
jgi:hypothetical protein